MSFSKTKRARSREFGSQDVIRTFCSTLQPGFPCGVKKRVVPRNGAKLGCSDVSSVQIHDPVSAVL